MTRRIFCWLLAGMVLVGAGGCKSKDVCCCDSTMSYKVGGDFVEAPMVENAAP